MDLEVTLNDMSKMPEINPVIGNGYSYERMKDSVAYVDSVLKSAFSTLKEIGLSYHGFQYLPLYESVHALSRTYKGNNRRALEVTHTSAFPISCHIKYTDPVRGGTVNIHKTTQVTFLRRGNLFTNKDSDYIVSPRLGDRVFSLDRDKIFVSISRSRIVFLRTPYFFNMDGRVVATDIHRARLYYDTGSTKQTKQNNQTIPTLVNYMLCEKGLTGMFKHFYGVDVQYTTEEDFNPDLYDEGNHVVCKSHGFLKGRVRNTNIVLIFKTKQFKQELMSVIGAVFYILDSCNDSPFLNVRSLEHPTGWIRALTKWAIEETNEEAAYSKISSHIESVKSYIDFTTQQRFKREGYKIKDIYDLFSYVIANFSVIASTHNVASMENKALSIMPHFLFRLTSSIFKMMFEIQKTAAKQNLTIPQVERLINSNWKEEAALSRITQEDFVRNLDHATDVFLLKATRLMVPQAKRGPGSKKTAEMSDPAFLHHWSKYGIISYQFTNKSCPTAIDSINPFAKLLDGDVLVPHENALPAIANIRELTELE